MSCLIIGALALTSSQNRVINKTVYTVNCRERFSERESGGEMFESMEDGLKGMKLN